MITTLDLHIDGVPVPLIRPDYQLNEMVAVVSEKGPWKEGEMVECEPDPRHFPKTGVLWKFLIALIGEPEADGPAGGKIRRLRGTLFVSARDLDHASNSALLYPNVRRAG